MSKPLLGEKAAVLVANGFCETDLTETQKLLQSLGVTLRLIGMDHGLVTGWKDNGWGLNFAADKALNSALAADFSMLVIPGGQRSIEKLKLTAHTDRFVKGFFDLHKPIIAFGESVELLSGRDIKGFRIAGAESSKQMLDSAGVIWSEAPYVVHENVMTAASMPVNGGDQTAAVTSFLTSHFSLVEAA